MKSATYRGIPCWYNPINEELKGKNLFFEYLLRIMVWIDVNIVEIDAFPLWIEVDKMEKN